MRRRPSPDHQEAVSRRLALLSAELAAVRGAPDTAPGAEAGREAGGEAGEEAGAAQPPDWTTPHTRIAARSRPPLRVVPQTSPPDPPDPPPALPVPGRHAARRPGSVLADAVPETLRGRAWLGPSQVAVLAVLVALGLAVTCWWVVRGRPREVGEPVVAGPAAALVTPASGPPGAGAPTPAAGDAGPVAASGAAGAGGTVTVDVEGRVRRPGIVVLDAGARVVDALERAGGVRPRVDLAGLNLARVLVDGEQVLVGVGAAPAPGAGAPVPAAPSPGAPGGALVNLNTATEPELEALPEVGPVTAQSILTWREEHGGFSSVDELLEVDGIGDATLSKLAPLVTV